jgi:demethylmenaquinone methyltransferase/2-methoxy-6-polyprenyl-1,4-benzoquinol methylase
VLYADRITAVDAAPEVLRINQRRTQSGKVNYLQADFIQMAADKEYDVVFFSFWLSHVRRKDLNPFGRGGGNEHDQPRLKTSR